MQRLYDKYITMHKEVFHLHGHQQCCTKIARKLIDIHVVFDHVQTWKMRYKGALLHLHKMMKLRVDLDKEHIWSLIQNYEEIPPLITSVEALLYKSFDVMVRKYATPSIGMLTKAKEKNQVSLELDTYVEHLMPMMTNTDLQVSADNKRTEFPNQYT